MIVPITVLVLIIAAALLVVRREYRMYQTHKLPILSEQEAERLAREGMKPLTSALLSKGPQERT